MRCCAMSERWFFSLQMRLSSFENLQMYEIEAPVPNREHRHAVHRHGRVEHHATISRRREGQG